jgi:hypothetical protein
VTDSDSLSVWRAVFDVAVHSMNFGSGFLDDEEVEALRAAAVLLGVSPDEATPRQFICKYRGHHAAQVFLDSPMFTDLEGILRNAYRGIDEFPEAARSRLTGTRPGDSLGMLRAPVLSMFCPDCGQRWDALEGPPAVVAAPAR